MTTKAKANRREPAAVKGLSSPTTTAKSKSKPGPSEGAGEENEICKLIARWKFLDADQKYQAALAESEFHLKMHEKEQDEIKNNLADLIPRNFNEVYELFDFAVAAILSKVERRDEAKAEIKMLKTLQSGILYAQPDEWARTLLKR